MLVLTSPCPDFSAGGGSGDLVLEVPTPSEADGELVLEVPTPREADGELVLEVPTPCLASGELPGLCL